MLCYKKIIGVINRMELRVLSYFLTVAREENITKAAALLHVTQPTLSRQLMQLEEELGVKLFIRSNHSIALTDEGMLLKRRAREIISLAEKTKQELNTEEQLTGEISVGSGELLAFSYLAEIISAFQKEYPLVNFDIYSGNADSIKYRIEKGLIDIGLLLVPVDIGKYDFLEMPGEEIWGALVHKDMPIAEKDFVTQADLLEEPIIMTKRTIVQNAIAGWFGKDFEQLNIIGTYNLLGNAAVMVQQKAGIALGIKRNCEFDSVCFIPLSPMLTSKTVLVWKKNQTMSRITNTFIDFAKKCINRISDN